MNQVINGTFKDCAQCPPSENCCTRLGAGQGMEAAPFAFLHEIEKIESYAPLRREQFIESGPFPPGHQIEHFVVNKGHCIFYQDSTCMIYPARPFICALFPFDFKLINDQLHWIVYTTLCPVRFDYRNHFDKAKKLLAASRLEAEQIKGYLREEAGAMACHEYIDLGLATELEA